MNGKSRYLLWAVIAVSLTGCGKAVNQYQLPALPTVEIPTKIDQAIVRSRVLLQVHAGESPIASWSQKLLNFFLHPYSNALAGSADSSVNISVTNAAMSTMIVDSSLFAAPPITNAILDFKYLQISALLDNQLDLCGANSNQHCNTALIRMYTTGTAAAGLYNSVDNYGAPITAGQTTLGSVGLGAANADILQSISLSSDKHVVHLSDFVSPRYDVQVDFTNAGAGSYSTTLVVEYALTP